METHLHLLYEQLDLFANILIEEMNALLAESHILDAWQRDDLETLAQEVDRTAAQYLCMLQYFQVGFPRFKADHDLLACLHTVMERSAALAHDDGVYAPLLNRLHKINCTAYDMFTIGCEIADV